MVLGVTAERREKSKVPAICGVKEGAEVKVGVKIDRPAPSDRWGLLSPALRDIRDKVKEEKQGDPMRKTRKMVLA